MNRIFFPIVRIKFYEKYQSDITHDKLIKTYKISLGRNPIGAKEFEGDKKTPEGQYVINDKNPNSRYHKNLGISYPNKRNIDTIDIYFSLTLFIPLVLKMEKS